MTEHARPAQAPPGQLPSRPGPASSLALPALFLLLGICWCAAPLLAYGAAIQSAPFFGEQPSPAEMATAHLYLWLAAASGLLAPALGFVIALASKRRPVASLFAVLLTLSLGAMVVLIGTSH